MRNKITTAADAVSIIQPRDTVCTSGFVGVGVPNELLRALEKRFLDTNAPQPGMLSSQSAGRSESEWLSLSATISSCSTLRSRVYAKIVADLEREYYGPISRYTTSAFMRLKLAQILRRECNPASLRALRRRRRSTAEWRHAAKCSNMTGKLYF
jgi:hypothetical protein